MTNPLQSTRPHIATFVMLAAIALTVACETTGPTSIRTASPQLTLEPLLVPRSAQTGMPLVFLDGRVATREDLRRVYADDVAALEVVKGGAALRLFGERARYGVIKVTTKPGAASRW